MWLRKNVRRCLPKAMLVAVLLAAVPGPLWAQSARPEAHQIALFPSAGDALGRQGFARVINHSDVEGEVRIDAFDDAGTPYGPLTLTLGAGRTVHFNSDDLESGKPDKRLDGATGPPGQGDWRLVLSSTLELEVLAYIRTGDGFLTSMHDLVPRTEAGYRVPIFNPGSNPNQVSWLRLINPGAQPTRVRIEGVDEAGHSPGVGVELSLAGGAARTLSASALESGAGLSGALGDGEGKWQLEVSADQPIEVVNVLSTPTGHLTNLSTAPGDAGTGDDGTAITHPAVEQRMVPITVDGQRVRLVVRIFRPQRAGPLPTLIFHHGSTGRGTYRYLFAHFQQPDTIVHYFVDRGWNVVLPSRRGRGGSEGGYDEGFAPDRSQGYSSSATYSLPGADRALADIDAIANEVLRWPFIDAGRVVVGGISRGGILSIAHAGQRPTWYRGVLNFVGGWYSSGYGDADHMNRTLFRRGVPFGKETLWLYASDDPFYGLNATRSYFADFQASGGVGVFVDSFPGEIGHGLALVPEHWGPHVDAYLDRLGLAHAATLSTHRFTPDPSLPPAAFLGQWNGWWGNIGTGTYTSVTISSVSAGGDAVGTYTFDTNTYQIGDSVADGVLRHQWSRREILELFLARDDALIATYREPKTASGDYVFGRAILTRVKHLDARG